MRVSGGAENAKETRRTRLRQKLDSILRGVIRRGFPELRRLRVGIAFEVMGPGDCLQCYRAGGRYRIAVSEAMRKAPRMAIEGGIAHELAHLAHDSRLGPFLRDAAWDRIARSRSFRIREERATDRRAIERGYGPHLLALERYARRMGIRFDRESGLLVQEIVAAGQRFYKT